MFGHDKAIPPPRVVAMMTESVETFRVSTGFAGQSGPDNLTVAVWLEKYRGVPRMHEYLLGGPELNIEFKLKAFKGFDNKSAGKPETSTSANIQPSQIRFRPGSNVGDWEPIEVILALICKTY